MVSTKNSGGHHGRSQADVAPAAQCRAEDAGAGRMPAAGCVGGQGGDDARVERQPRAQVAPGDRSGDRAARSARAHPRRRRYIHRTRDTAAGGGCSTAGHPHRVATRSHDYADHLADFGVSRLRNVDTRVAAGTRIDSLWLAARPVDMRAGADRLLASVVQVFGSAQAHHGYLFANARATRIKLLVHDGFGVWCAARRLNAGRFVWPREVAAHAAPMTLTQAQFDALVLGLPWQRLAQMQLITRM